jgi:hypothetical protein
MVFLPILFLTFAFAQEDLAIETYCFSSPESRSRVEKKLSYILVPSDKIESDKSCFTLQMRPHRRELLQNYVRSVESEVNITYSSAEIKREPCLIKVEKLRVRKNTNSNITISQTPDATAGQLDESAKDIMEIQTLGPFSLVVSQDAIEGSCRFITKDVYELSINARRDLKQTVPANLTPGSLVVIPTPPPDEKTLNVKTTIQLRRGERTEIGSIIKELRKKNQIIDVKPEVQSGMVEQTEDEKVFFSFQ